MPAVTTPEWLLATLPLATLLRPGDEDTLRERLPTTRTRERRASVGLGAVLKRAGRAWPSLEAPSSTVTTVDGVHSTVAGPGDADASS